MTFPEEFKFQVLRMASKATNKPAKSIESFLSVPKDPKFGDLSLPAFPLARKGQDPAKLASDLWSKMKPSGLVSDIRTEGPYINFYADWQQGAAQCIKEVLKSGPKYGHWPKAGSKFMVEYAQPNPLKAFHIGHVRNIALGEALSRILEASGAHVVRANYQGDVGPHVAKCLWGFIKLHKKTPPKKGQGIWLGEVYAEANAKSSEPKVEKEIREIQQKLFEGDKKLVETWQKTRKWSLDYFDEIYADFGAKFNRLYFESEMEKPGKEISHALEKKGIAKLSEGAIVVDMKKENLGVFVLLTQEGLPLYSAKDLALAERQAADYDVDKIIHVVGSEQKHHFRQLFNLLEKTRPSIAKKELHLSYELVTLPEGKMSSRAGTIITYDKLKSELLQRTSKEVSERNPKMKKKDQETLAKSIALGALKYDMVFQSPEKTISFDWDRALDLTGNSAPYIQYTHARACSILERIMTEPTRENFDHTLLALPEEKALVKSICEFPDAVANAASAMRPHFIAQYAHNLAVQFNDFYQKTPVLKANSFETRLARLALVKAFKQTIANALNLLGIEALERM